MGAAMQIESSVVELLSDWARWAPQEAGDELDYPRGAPFEHMRGGSIGLPPGHEPTMMAVDHAVAVVCKTPSVGRVYKHVINGHFRKHLSYYRMARDLHISPQQVASILATAINRVEGELWKP